MLGAEIINKKIIHDALGDAKKKAPAESCGVVVFDGLEASYVSCRNISLSADQFVIHPGDYACAEDVGEIVSIVHSHPDTKPDPSSGDLVGVEKTQLPWLIVNPLTEQFTVTEPSGFKLPIIGREFHHGVVDCLAIIQDVYSMIGIQLPDYEREDNWWLTGKNYYLDNFEACGFYRVDDLQDFDVVVMQIQSPVPNHGAIFLEGNLIQHCQGRPSSRDVFDGMWRKTAAHFLRHNDIETANKKIKIL